VKMAREWFKERLDREKTPRGNHRCEDGKGMEAREWFKERLDREKTPRGNRTR
jgi:hypothetical protein